VDVVNGSRRPQPLDRVSPHAYVGLERGGAVIQRRPDRIGCASDVDDDDDAAAVSGGRWCRRVSGCWEWKAAAAATRSGITACICGMEASRRCISASIGSIRLRVGR
jgi:hypothetical protein